MKLPGGIGDRRAIIVDKTDEEPTISARNFGPIAVNAPVVKGFEEGSNLILLFKLESIAVDPEKGEGVFVTGFEVDAWRVEALAAQVKVSSTLLATVHYRRHCNQDPNGGQEWIKNIPIYSLPFTLLLLVL